MKGSNCYGKSHKEDRSDECLEKGIVHEPNGLVENSIGGNPMKEASYILSRYR
jgi:hypothetical protein